MQNFGKICHDVICGVCNVLTACLLLCYPLCTLSDMYEDVAHTQLLMGTIKYLHPNLKSTH